MPRIDLKKDSKENSSQKNDTPKKPTSAPAVEKTTVVEEEQGNRRVSFILGTIFMVIGVLVLLYGLGRLLVKSLPHFERNDLPVPVLAELPEYTNRDLVDIEGTVEGQYKVYLVVNDEMTELNVESDDKGYFAFNNYYMPNEGEYRFKAVSTREGFFRYRSAYSNEVVTMVDRTPPLAEIEFKKEIPEEVTEKSLKIEGQIPEEGKVTVEVGKEEYEAKTDEDGNFEVRVDLKKGTNSLKFTIEDKSGNKIEFDKRYKVNYKTKKQASVNGNGVSTKKTTAAKTGKKQLPESAGELEQALSEIFHNRVFVLIACMAIIVFAASSSVVWLWREYRG